MKGSDESLFHCSAPAPLSGYKFIVSYLIVVKKDWKWTHSCPCRNEEGNAPMRVFHDILIVGKEFPQCYLNDAHFCIQHSLSLLSYIEHLFRSLCFLPAVFVAYLLSSYIRVNPQFKWVMVHGNSYFECIQTLLEFLSIQHLFMRRRIETPQKPFPMFVKRVRPKVKFIDPDLEELDFGDIRPPPLLKRRV